MNGGKDFAFQTVALGSDIQYSNGQSDPWTPIGNAQNQFHGIFDGKNFQISGIFIDEDERGVEPVGFFGFLGAFGVVKNLKLRAEIWSLEQMGGLVAINEGIIDNCHTLPNNFTSRIFVGGLAGINRGIIKNSSSSAWVKTTIVFDDAFIGGLVAQNFGLVENCVFDGSVLANGTQTNFGSLLGFNNGKIYGSLDKSAFDGELVGNNIGVIENTKKDNDNGDDGDDGESSIFDRRQTDKKFGVIVENALASQVAKFSVKTPEAASVNIVIFDNLGNAVFKTSGKSDEVFVWDLRNAAGRFVANGTYLAAVEARGLVSKKAFTYFARFGVKR